MSHLLEEFQSAFEECSAKTKKALTIFQENFKGDQNTGEIRLFAVDILTQFLTYSHLFIEKLPTKLSDLIQVIEQCFITSQKAKFLKKSKDSSFNLGQINELQRLMSQSSQKYAPLISEPPFPSKKQIFFPQK